MNFNFSPNKLLGYSLAGVAVVGGVLYISNRTKKNREETDANNAREILGTNTNAGRAVTFATTLRTAMKGWGTKEDIIYAVFTEATEQGLTFGDISKAYTATYQRDLLKDLQKELRDSEYAKVTSIITNLSGLWLKPKDDATMIL